MSIKTITTFHVDTEDHNAFKVECIKRGSDMTKELNKFIKKFNQGEDDPIGAYSEQIGITREELIERLNNMSA